MPSDRKLRVAMTLEQCWHRVPGGTAVAAIEGARALSHFMDVIGVSARHRAAPPAPWTPPVPVKPLPLPRVALYESWHRLRVPRVETATGRVDIVHATTLAIPPRSAPLVVTIHDLAFLTYPEHFTARGLRFFTKGLALARRDADLVLCSSTATLEQCRDYGFPAERLRHVSLGVRVQTATEREVEEVRVRYGLTRPYVMWTGTVEPRKNLRGLIEAHLSLDSELDLVLVGPRGWNEDVDRMVKGRTEHIKPLGFVPGSDLGALYAGAEVFCYPSLMEGFGFPVLEAMAQSTPVVTSRGTSTEELAGPDAVLVDPHDPASIAAGLNEVFSNDDLATRLAEAGPARAATFSWERNARDTAAAYREVAE
ncbi:MAG: glycosyltransferase family 4 protein [Actinomycetota bacterium]|nr:glycosyltransferase family 4 protein [Actinomycetota bacterium]